jgi:hypothetical protein
MLQSDTFVRFCNAQKRTGRPENACEETSSSPPVVVAEPPCGDAESAAFYCSNAKKVKYFGFFR